MKTITFLGGGNMATAIIGGLVANGTQPTAITVVEPHAEQRERLQRDYGVGITSDAARACNDAETVVLAVKPQVIPQVAESLKAEVVWNEKLLISIAAGVTLATLETLFGTFAIARAMPNTPALLRLGATGLYFNAQTTPAQRATAQTIIEAFGISIVVEREDLLDAVTAVSGSGPAYYFLMIEAMINAGTALGLSAEDAKTLTLQTALGAASMATQSDVSPEELRRRVTSPNGTTHAAITSMQRSHFGAIVEQAMIACRDRAVELGSVPEGHCHV